VCAKLALFLTIVHSSVSSCLKLTRSSKWAFFYTGQTKEVYNLQLTIGGSSECRAWVFQHSECRSSTKGKSARWQAELWSSSVYNAYATLNQTNYCLNIVSYKHG